MLHCPVYSRTRKWGPGSRLVRGASHAAPGLGAAYDDTGRCAYHTPPYACTLVDSDADGPGLIEICGLAPAEPASVPPETRPDAVTQILGARRMSAATGADAATEIRKRPANLMTWCERCATGVHFRCANDHTIGHGGDDCIGAYRAKDIAAKFRCSASAAGRLIDPTCPPTSTIAMKMRLNEATNLNGTQTGPGGAGPAG